MKPDGSCVHLGDGELCKIYYARPKFCRVQPGSHEKTALECNKLQKKLKLPVKYRVELK